MKRFRLSGRDRRYTPWSRAGDSDLGRAAGRCSRKRATICAADSFGLQQVTAAMGGHYQKSCSDCKAYQLNKWISKTDLVQVHLLRRCKDLPNLQVSALQLLKGFFGIDLPRVRIGA